MLHADQEHDIDDRDGMDDLYATTSNGFDRL